MFCLIVVTNKRLKRAKENDRGNSRFAIIRGAVNRDIIVIEKYDFYFKNKFHDQTYHPQCFLSNNSKYERQAD